MKLRLLSPVIGIGVFLSGCSGRTEPSVDALQTAKRLCGSGQHKRCVEILKTAVEKNSSDPEIRYRLGLAFRDLGDLENATGELYHAHKLQPDFRDSLVRLAEVMVKSSDVQYVVWSGMHADRVLATKRDPLVRADALFALGVGKLRLGETEAAMRAFHDAVSANPQQVPAAINLAVLKWMRQESAAAAAILKDVAGKSNSTAALAAAGEFYALAGDHGEAEKYFRRVLEIDPKHPPALLNLAGTLIAAQRLEEAGQMFARLAQLPRYRHLYAGFLFQTGRFDSAISELRSLAAADPTDPVLRRCLHAALVSQERYQEAAREAQAILRKHPCNLDALLLLGQIAISTGNYPEAAARTERSLACDSESAEAPYLRALRAAAQGDRGRADYELENALRRDRDFMPARLLWIRSLIGRRRPEPALNVFREAQRLQRKARPDARLLPPAGTDDLPEGALACEYTWMLIASGDSTAALSWLDSRLAVERTPEVLIQRALAGFQAGQPNATAFLQEALRFDPSSRGARRALKLLSAKPSDWPAIAVAVADECRRPLLWLDLLDLPHGVVRTEFQLHEPLERR